MHQPKRNRILSCIGAATAAGVAGVMLAGATLCMIAMEERPLAGPGTPAEMAE